MGTSVRRLDLRALADGDGPGWATTTIPESSPPVRLLRLHHDRATKASVSLVAFPRGWSRAAAGAYTAGEEFLVLCGGLAVSGRRYDAGAWAWLPAGALRVDSTAPSGALAVAWFSGPPTWVPHRGPEPARTGPRPSCAPPTKPPTKPEPVDACRDRELLCPGSWQWAWVPAGHPAPHLAEPAFVRFWP